ncbi:MAG: YafY family transcriptional regulator [Aureispira sp.]|nr:YafY family transcriptional regulator [Aureispira sp.]
MNKFDRVISILILLQTRKVIKASSIAEKFEISLRTVYRDIKTLKTAGIPIIGDPGVGYSIMDGYKMPPVVFNQQEAMALWTAEKLIGQVTDKETEAFYLSAMTKIKAVLRTREKDSLETLESFTHFSSSQRWENKTYLQTIFSNIAARKVLKLHYKKANSQTASIRKIEPIGCYHNYNNWYLVAYCYLREEYRTFKVNRIERLEVIEELFDRKHLSLNEYLQQQVQSRNRELEIVVVRFHKSIVKYAENSKYSLGWVREEEEEEYIKMTFLTSSIEFMARWLIPYLNQVEIDSPSTLKKQMQDFSKIFYKHYHS